ncbi:hypothetical protein FOA52_012449 [Chlamydomonas sp. UWO 241]|nr:hypothetical protein FOA52_012449 [Chlamydomonas sp. UWO 241]
MEALQHDNEALRCEVEKLRKENNALRRSLLEGSGAFSRSMLIEGVTRSPDGVGPHFVSDDHRAPSASTGRTAPASDIARENAARRVADASAAVGAAPSQRQPSAFETSHAAAPPGPTPGVSPPPPPGGLAWDAGDAALKLGAASVSGRQDAPLEMRMSDIEAFFRETSAPGGVVWKFARLIPGDTLQTAAAAAVAANGGVLPNLVGQAQHVAWISRAAQGILGAPGDVDMPFEVMAARFCKMWTTNSYVPEWHAQLKNLLLGIYDPVYYRALRFAHPDLEGSRSAPLVMVNWQVVIVDDDGSRWWGAINQDFKMPEALVESWGMRDLLAVKYNPACVTVVARAGGTLLWQNASSMGTFGCHALFNCITSLSDSEGDWLQGLASAHNVTNTYKLRSHDFMQLLFHDNLDQLEALSTTLTSGSTFACRLCITHPLLRACMRLQDNEQSYHDLQVSLTKDPVNLQPLYIISQMEVTEHVLAQHALVAANVELQEQQTLKAALVARQYDLIACLGMVSDVGASAPSNKIQADLINAVKQDLFAGGKSELAAGNEVELLEDLGAGAFGKVYRGLWKGTVVAVKSMLLQGGSVSSSSHRERMAIMEAGISKSLSHPNIVQTYTYSIRPINSRGQNTTPGSSGSPGKTVGSGPTRTLGTSDSSGNTVNSGFEVQLVLEFCDCGTLWDAIAAGCFQIEDEALNYRMKLDTLLDIAKGMVHLHSLNIIHADLKPNNVLLRSSGADERGAVAKLSDFGLSFQLDTAETHASNRFAGTLSHMSPEVMTTGKQSKAADVYSFGICMWELYTGELAFHGQPAVLLPHQVVQERLRPVFPTDTPRGYAQLAQECWAPEAALRPSFTNVLRLLRELAQPGNAPLPLLLPASGVSPAIAPAETGGAAAGTTAAAAPEYALNPFAAMGWTDVTASAPSERWYTAEDGMAAAKKG